jgi:restriction system protein
MRRPATARKPFMKWKMSDRSLFAVLLRSPWWISLVLAAALALAASALLPEAYKSVGALSSFPFVVVGVIAAWRQRANLSPEQAQALQTELAAMNWRAFSQLLQHAYVQQGYGVTAVPNSAMDLKLTRQGQTTVVCAKRWKAASWGLESLQALVAERAAMDATHLVCVSLQDIPPGLKKFVQEHGVTWLSGQSLWALVAPHLHKR